MSDMDRWTQNRIEKVCRMVERPKNRRLCKCKNPIVYGQWTERQKYKKTHGHPDSLK